MAVQHRAHRTKRGTLYLAASPAATAADWACDTPAQAIRIAQWLASVEARDGPAQDRRARAAALIAWIEDYAQHVERVEHGCQRLLLQAADMIGRRDVRT